MPTVDIVHEEIKQDEEQGGIAVDADGLFGNLENNIDRYQIDTQKNGSIIVKIGTIYQKGGGKSIMKSIKGIEEEKFTEEEEIAAVFG